MSLGVRGNQEHTDITPCGCFGKPNAPGGSSEGLPRKGGFENLNGMGRFRLSHRGYTAARKPGRYKPGVDNEPVGTLRLRPSRIP
jgi:hypothetical protein